MPEWLADGLEIDQIDFMQCRYFLDLDVEFGESLGQDFIGSVDRNVDVGVRVSGDRGPGSKPDDRNVGVQRSTCQIGYVTSDLSRASEK